MNLPVVKRKEVCAHCKLFEPTSNQILFEKEPHGWCNLPKMGSGRQPKAWRDRRHPLDWCDQFQMRPEYKEKNDE